MSNIKQAVILCAGLGTRLRPLTDTMPKPMIPLSGKPLLEWNIEQFKKHGVTEFLINLYYLPDVIRDYFGDGSKWGVKINYFQEKEALGTAGGVKDFANMLDDTFYVIYGDMFSQMDYSKMAAEFARHPDAIGMQKMQRTDDYEGADVAELAQDGSYLQIHPKPHTTHYPNVYRMRGVFILKKEIIDYVPANTYYEIGKQLLPDVVSRGKKFYSYECEDYTKCIENAETYGKVQEYAKKTVGVNSKQKISACLIVYNEEKIIRRCLDSIKDLADEIIVVHDGECKDKTLEIAREYTDKVFVQPHAGISTLHFVFCFNKAIGDWILLMDADEYLEAKDFPLIREKISRSSAGGTNQNGVNRFIFNWEMWDGVKTLRCKGIQKACLFKKSVMHFVGIPHAMGEVDGKTEKLDIYLRHKPLYNNISWKSFNRKKAMWVPLHAKYFFPELVQYECFNSTADKWIEYANQVRNHPIFYLTVYPLKTLLGQLKNGLWGSWTGINIACQQYIYYLCLHYEVWKIQKKSPLS